MTKKLVIYTRYSTDMQSPKSCTDQEREVREGLAKKGIDATAAEVIHDEAESGTKTFRVQFERLAAMMRAGELGLLAVDDQARLTRADNAYAFITDIVYHGGRFTSTGEGIDTAEPGWQLRVKVMDLHNSTTIHELGRRVRRGQHGRLLADLTAGDYPYGYESFLVRPEQVSNGRGPKPEKDVRINEDEARWVVQIFEWFVACWSIAAIGRELTRLSVSRGSRRQGSAWSHQQVRSILTNPKYIGTWVWGATTTIRDSSGKKKQVPVPRAEQVTRLRPALRIVEQDLFDAAQQRMREISDVFGKKPGQKPRGPRVHHTAVYPSSLLGGLVFCGQCGARMWQQASGPRLYLGCPNRGKGDGKCAMMTTVPLAKAEPAVLGFVGDLLSGWPEWLKHVVASMRVAISEAARQIPADMVDNEKRCLKLQSQISNLVAQLADGALESRAVRQVLTEKETQLETLQSQLAQNQRLVDVDVDLPSDRWIQEQLRDLASVLTVDQKQAAVLLRKLLGKITAQQVPIPGKARGYTQLRFQICGWEVLKALLGKKLPPVVAAKLTSVADGGSGSEEFVLDMGGPSRMDTLGPQLARLRAEGKLWKEICELTGLGSGPAYVAWTRYVDSQQGQESKHDGALQEGGASADDRTDAAYVA